MIRAKVTTKDNGKERMRRLQEALRKYPKAYVTIGIHQDAGAYSMGRNNPTVVEVALWNEFGTRTVPQRSFVNAAVDEHAAQINAWRDEMITNILFNDWPVEKALHAMGLRIQILIQNKIKSNTQPEYGTGRGGATQAEIERARERKRREWGSTSTLMASKIMLRSVTYKVHLS